MRAGNGGPAGFDELGAEYEILGELGRGGMAVVYHARERTGGREVALKLMRAKYVEDEEVLARFAHEARTLPRLKHPHIVSTLAVRQLEDGGLALVMEYVPGRTLREVIRQRGPLPYLLAERVLCEIGQALAYAHRRRIVHRDVKPDNIFLHELTGAALLSDFGIAKTRDSDTQLTMTGVALGTPAYMSPEQIDGVAVDGRSDLFSLGLVGWEMLTGRRPWEGETLYSTLHKQKHEELSAVRELRPDIPEYLELLIEGALLKDPAARWANVEDFLTQFAPEAVALHRRLSRAGERRRQQVMRNVQAARERRAAAAAEEELTIRYPRLPTPAPESAPAPAPVPAPAAAWPRHRLTTRTAVLAAGFVLLATAAASLLASVAFRTATPVAELAATQPLPGDEGAVPAAAFLPPEGFGTGTPDAAVSETADERPGEGVAPEVTESSTGAAEGNAPTSPQPAGESARPQREPAAPSRQEAASAPRSPAPQGPRLLGEPVGTSPAAQADESSTSAAAPTESAERSSRRPAPRRNCAAVGASSGSRAQEECAIRVGVGQSFQLTTSVGFLPGRFRSVPEVGWSSSNPSVATVDENGLVRGIRPGLVTITATAAGMAGSTIILVTAPDSTIR